MKKGLSIIIGILAFLLISNFMTVEAYDFGTYDLGGETITFIHDSDLRIDKEGERVAKVEDKYNINLEFRKLSDLAQETDASFYGSLVNRVIAGDAEYDIWQAVFQRESTPWPLAVDGLVYPIGEILDDEYYNEYLPAPYNKFARDFSLKGKIYGFGYGVREAEALFQASFMAYNPELFEEEGLPDLHELYEEGEWTWDNFIKIAEDATKEDRPAIANGSGMWRVLSPIVATMGGSYARYVDGKMKATLNEPEVIKSVELFRKLLDMEAITEERIRTGFLEGEYPMFYMGLLGWYLPHLYDGAEIDYKMVPFPRPKETESHKIAVSQRTMMLPASTAEPEAMLAIYHDLFPPEEERNSTEEYLENNLRDRKSFEILLELLNKSEIAYYAGGEKDVYGIAYGAIDFPSIIGSEESPAASLEAQNPELQAVLDDIFN